MPKRLAMTNLNGRTIDILNVIRANASYEYQQNVPEINDAEGIPRVGEAVCGNPTLQNEFINALVNRIALVVINSATFNNPYEHLKKGFIEFGESVEEIFIQIAKVQEYSAEKAAAREFKRTIPNVKSIFHTMNWRVMYPVTIQREDLRRAFLSADGVENLITGIIEQIYTAHNYDEFLLFKYLLIKQIAHGKAYPIAIDTSNTLDAAAAAFRGTSNMLTFMKDGYNAAGVLTNTPKERQVIFMDAEFNARFDVEELSRAFNMDKAEFFGALHLIDEWDSFDNARWSEIKANSDMVEDVTADELTLMSDVRAVLVDERWFQVYDNEATMTDQRSAAGLYWNYFYHSWKTVSVSPFANIVAFVEDSATITAPETLTFTISGIVTSDVSTIVMLEHSESETLANTSYNFVQTGAAVEDGIAVTPDGAFIFPDGETTVTPVLTIGNVTYNGTAIDLETAEVGATITFTKQS